MSHSVTTDICKNVANIGDVLGPLYDQEQLADMLFYEEIERETDGSIIDPEFKKTSAYKAGWRTKESVFEDCLGAKNRLYADILLVKDDYVVFAINSSQYNNVGEVDFVIFSDNREAVEMLIVDIGNDLQEWQKKVNEVDTVEHWS